MYVHVVASAQTYSVHYDLHASRCICAVQIQHFQLFLHACLDMTSASFRIKAALGLAHDVSMCAVC